MTRIGIRERPLLLRIDQVAISSNKHSFANFPGSRRFRLALKIIEAKLKHLSMLAENAGGWSHWDQIALGADNGTSNNKIEVRLGYVK